MRNRVGFERVENRRRRRFELACLRQPDHEPIMNGRCDNYVGEPPVPRQQSFGTACDGSSSRAARAANLEAFRRTRGCRVAARDRLFGVVVELGEVVLHAAPTCPENRHKGHDMFNGRRGGRHPRRRGDLRHATTARRIDLTHHVGSVARRPSTATVGGMTATELQPTAIHIGADELPFVDIGGGTKLKVIQVKERDGLWIIENIFQAGLLGWS